MASASARLRAVLLPIAALIAAGALGVHAQEGIPQAAPRSLPAQIKDLKYQSLGLNYRVENLKGATQSLQVKETPLEVRIELPGDILFDFDKATIRAAAEPTLGKVADVIKRYHRPQVSIDGYTDSKGNAAYNLALSRRRAESVKGWLLGKGGVDAVIETRGWGKEHPVAPNRNPDGSDNPAGRQQNRRVEITVKKS